MEHLKRRYGLRSVKNGYRAYEITFSRGKIKEACEANLPRSNPHSSLRTRRKNWSFEGLLWSTELGKCWV